MSEAELQQTNELNMELEFSKDIAMELLYYTWRLTPNEVDVGSPVTSLFLQLADGVCLLGV